MRRKPIQREKPEQAAIVQLLHAIGAAVYVLGTRRPAGKPCPTCGTFVPEHQGTRQTPGLPDLYAVLPPHPPLIERRVPLWIEVKAPASPGHSAGTLSADQRAFRDLAHTAKICYVAGGLDDVIAWLIGASYLKADQVPHYRVRSSETRQLA